jgi:hypothetical protein
MRFPRIGLVFSLALVGAASACGSITSMLQNDGGGGKDGGGQDGGGQDGGPAACRTLTETACRARTDCAVGNCSLCGGTPQFAGCYDPAHESPPACLGIACPAPCSSFTDATTCQAAPGCAVRTCPDCNGGSSFAACTTPDAGFNCPAISCPLPCGQVTAKDACEARADCHSVFVDPHNCACAAAGCCAQFSRCAAGDKATCKPPTGLACGAATPYCEGPYVVSYTATCFEGCVQSTDCAP